jgi:hypothetical protein
MQRCRGAPSTDASSCCELTGEGLYRFLLGVMREVGLRAALRARIDHRDVEPTFEEWTSALGSERLTGALLDRLTHRGQTYRKSTLGTLETLL